MSSKLSIKRTKFGGLAAMEIRTTELRLVVITAKGPRIAVLTRGDGPNLLMWAPGKYLRGKWDLMGGHRLWVARPGADEAEETYATDNQACTVETFAKGFTVSAPVDPIHRTQRGVKFTVRAADRIEIEHFVTNHSDMLWSGGLWGLTCTLPIAGTTYQMPLGDGSSWDYATMVAFRTWGGGHGGAGFGDDQFRLTDDALVLNPAGRENKRMVKADPGIVAMHDPARKVLFAIHAAYQPDGNYPLGTNLAFYVGPKNFMVEMETMSPLTTLKPQQTLKHTETWLLREAKNAPTAKTLKTLF
ncbi:hypothetical protein ESB00_04095 [Oleiharenicola lentus]|jgi:hypothetical protein|uniref:DUF4380 domain-containing protein n=1 Tax=Oleiharenicola lentus TaxID=2508720 RepID=A0A4V1M6E2_9BACT|nr:hypothetical protein [Oleiharenicola lentus]RXK55089.1 hypothetical protein ESB00_04095 [Oleiharenicola lentus]